jgi:hypothetical protein
MEIVRKAVVEEHNQEQFTTVISSSQAILVQMDQKAEAVILTIVHQVVEEMKTAVLQHQKQTDMVLDLDTGDVHVQMVHGMEDVVDQEHQIAKRRLI